MLSSDESKAGGKPKDRKGKPPQGNRKERRAKAAAPVPETDQPQSVAEEMGEPVAVAETIMTLPAATESVAPLPSVADTSPVAPSASKESAPVSYRAIADAWVNYSRTSLEQTRSYFEKLAGVRSLGAAFEIQAEFAKQACDIFVAQSQRIGELQGELVQQRFKRLGGFMEKMTLGALGTHER
jgi:hypothetical protein